MINVMKPYSPGKGQQFDYKAGAAGVKYEVELISTLITDHGYYRWQFTPSDTAWHTAVVYFPDVAGATNAIWQPSARHGLALDGGEFSRRALWP